MTQAHQVCIDQLNHYLTKALVCGAKMPLIEDKFLLQQFGLIHFLIISGAHIQFILSFFETTESFVQEKLNYSSFFIKLVKHLCLFLICLTTSFSGPVMRAYGQVLISLLLKKILLRQPSVGLKTVFVFFLVSPLAYLTHKEVSFFLSLAFSLICSLAYSKKLLPFSIKIYLLSLPLYFSFFTPPPHLISIVLNPCFSFLTAFLFMPMSFLSLFSNSIESLVVHLWWASLDLLHSVHIFLDLGSFEKTKTFFNLKPALFYFAVLFVIEIFIRPLWIRKSYSFSSSS